MSGRILALCLVGLTLLMLGAAFARPSTLVTPSGTTIPVGDNTETERASRTETPTPPGAGVSSTPAGTPPPVGVTPSGGIGEPASYCKPGYCAETLSGQATWWNSYGPGLYAAIRPDLGTKGDLAIVCGGAPFHCLSIDITTTCACLGPGSGRLIDLSLDAFRSFADPSAGVVHITLEVLHR